MTVDQKRQRKQTSEICLALYKQNPSEFLRRFVTVDEIWIHHYTPETKEQFKQWTAKDKPAPKKAKAVPSAAKDSAPAHTSAVSMAKLHESRYELLPHPPYYPDMAPCVYHLFPNLKKWLGGKKFSNDNEVKQAVNGYFEDLDQSTYKTDIQALEHRWTKCIALKGDYVEN
ncbi:hypothetical protein WDU94_003680 [Cyamophila willieti]